MNQLSTNNKYIYWFFSLALLLLVVFCWKERFSISELIDHEKFASYFTCLTFFAAIISLVFLYNQGLEMRMAYAPEIYPYNDNFKCTDIDYGHYNYPSFNNERLNPLNNKIKNDDYFEFINGGFGSAKDIVVQWIYDVNEVRKYNQKSYAYVIDPEAQPEIEKFLFVRKDDKLTVRIPETFFYCYGNLNNFYSFKHLVQERDHPDRYYRPSLLLDMKYKDIRSNQYHRQFKVSFEAIKYNVNETDISIVTVQFATQHFN